MTENGQWEAPFETAVREINEEIVYRNIQNKQWSSLDIKLLRTSDRYLDCTLNSEESEYRRIGLFLVYLPDDLEFSVKDEKEIDVCMKISNQMSSLPIDSFF